MINPTYPGVYVREESSGARAVAGVPTSIAAFVGMTERGPLNEPTQVFNLQDYERVFGSGPTGGQMLPQVKLFYDNGGGQAYITRIANNAQQANIEVRDEAGNAALEFTAKGHGIAGNKIRVEVTYDSISPESLFNLRIYRRNMTTTGVVTEDDVETFTNLSMDPSHPAYVETVVTLQSALVSVQNRAAAPAPGADSTLYSGLIYPNTPASAIAVAHARLDYDGQATKTFNLQIRIDQAPPVTCPVALTDGANLTAIGDALTDALNDATDPGVVFSVSWDNNAGQNRRQMVITCADHAFELLPGVSDDLTAAFMLTEAQGALYLDRYAGLRPAPNGLVSRVSAAPGSGDIDRLTEFSILNKTAVTHIGATHSGDLGFGDGEAVTYSTVGDMRTGTVYVPAPPDNAEGSMLNLRENLQSLATALSTVLGTAAAVSVHGFRIVIQTASTGSDADANFAVQTSNADFTNPITAPLEAAGQILDSAVTLFNVKAYTLGTASGAAGAGAYQNRAGAADGDDGTVPTLPDYRAAFAQLQEQVDLFNLMVLPRCHDGIAEQSDTDRKAAFNVGSAICAKERAFLLVDPPATDPVNAWTSVTAAQNGANLLRVGLETKSSAVYWPRLKMANGTFQDPGGAIAGLMARTDGTRGVWKAAAGVEATIRGIAGVEYPMSDDQNGVLNPLAVNAIRLFPSGVLSWGARSLVGFNSSGDQDNKYSNVVRTKNFIQESLYRGLRFAVFESNAEPLWAQIRLAAGSFMNGLYRQGAFKGETASDAFYVICDKTTTTPTDINLGIVNVVVAFAPLKPAEFVVLTVKQIAGQAQS